MPLIQDEGYYSRLLAAIRARGPDTHAPADIDDLVIPVLVINGLLTPVLGATVGVPTVPQSPAQPVVGTVLGNGTQVTRFFPSPAVGTDWPAIVVPAGERWRVLSLFTNFLTSGAVAPRVPQFIIDDNGQTNPPTVNRLFMTSTAASASAGDTDFWVWAWGLYQEPVGKGASPAVGGIRVVPFPNFMLYPGYRIRVVTANLQAGDQWGQQMLTVELF